MKKVSIFLLFLLVSLLFLPFFPLVVKAAGASLSFSPNSGSYEVGKNFSVTVVLNSGGGLGVNAADGLIKFNSSEILVTKVSKVGSIFSLWTTEPTYSNSAGTISFSGGSPGAYKGSAGTVFSISFSTKKTGDTVVSFTSGNILAADGKGTNVLSGMGKATFNITEAKKEDLKKETVKPKNKKETKSNKSKGILPPVPEINSKTHPDTNTWYSNNNPEFSWKILADLTGVSFAITDNSTDDPGQENDGIIETERFEKQKDGEQYFHIKYQNQYGWGQVAHRKLLIDVTPPNDFDLIIDNQGDPTNPQPKLIFSTNDKTSGIDYYNIKLADKNIKVGLTDVDMGYYQLEVLAPGEYQVAVAAVDKAGNTASTTAVFTIDPLKAPIITSIPETISKKEDLLIQGTSFYSNVHIKIFITQAGQETINGESETDESGNWSFVYKNGLAKGGYEISSIVVDDRGAMSLSSTKKFLKVTSPSLICAYGWWIVLVSLLLMILAIAYVFYQRREFIAERLRIKRETDELKTKMSKIFYALREELDELMELADKKAGLSESERRVKEKIQESLDISEEFINKEVADVEKEIKLPSKEK